MNPIDMTTLGMLQLVSPALPVGGFSYSEGLEWLVQSKRITDESTLLNWISSELLRGQIRVEAASQTYIKGSLEKCHKTNDEKAISDLLAWDSWLLAFRDSEEVRKQQKQMGRSLIELLIDLGHPISDELQNCSWPISWVWGGMLWELNTIEIIECYLYSWVANQLSAGVRLIPLGATQAQRLQFSLLPLIRSQAKILLNTDPHTLWTGDVGAIMAQASHPELYSKLFIS